MGMFAEIWLYRVRGISMMPTLREGDYLLVRRREDYVRPLRRGDVIVVETEGRIQLKRIVGLPGESVVFRDGTLLVDDERLKEQYLRGLPPHPGLGCFRFALASDEYFLMGDNRARSTDSRHYGPVTRSSIGGRVVFLVWPPTRWGRL